MIELGINHQSPLIHFVPGVVTWERAGNQSPIPFDTLAHIIVNDSQGWESITNPL